MSALSGLHEDVHVAHGADRETSAVEARLPLVDWPTLALATAIYAGFGLLTWFARDLPWWLILPPGAVLVCLQASLQHEAVHGYPTRWRWLNYAIAAPAFWLWLPFGINRDEHLKHHADENLTDPARDPESNYLLPETWARFSPLHRALRRCMGTLLGRIVLGPVYYAAIALRGLGVALVKRDRIALRHWTAHGAALAALFWWLTQVCGIPLLDYVLLFAWPGAGLAQIRSFAEHRAAPDALARTAVVEAGGLMSFLFLYNNLHALHHAEPGLAWHRRPGEYRRRRPEILARSHYHLIPGYAFLFRNYLLDAKEPLLHPGMARRSVARPATQTPGPASEALAPAS